MSCDFESGASSPWARGFSCNSSFGRNCCNTEGPSIAKDILCCEASECAENEGGGVVISVFKSSKDRKENKLKNQKMISFKLPEKNLNI